MRTFSPKVSEITREWLVIDAEGLVLGRVATVAASLLRGKHRVYFAPHVDCGDNVIIVNADKVVLTANKAAQKFAYHHSGYPGGLRATSWQTLLDEDPVKLVFDAVQGHGSQEPTRSRDHGQALRLRRPRAPARRPESPRSTTPRPSAAVKEN